MLPQHRGFANSTMKANDVDNILLILLQLQEYHITVALLHAYWHVLLL